MLAEERKALRGPGLGHKVKLAAEQLNRCRMDLAKAALAFKKVDTVETRRDLAEADWRYVAARSGFYEARARCELAREEQEEPKP